eukprot:TRINITY_DN7902_c0_g1_i2.p1 TRINITY_DN7902_c0_g1~~TRINITY_DN7902_c0_g1_i2.p1  ORF type:complete len:649 (-),score=184.19 TRINITY_DN7902_c0_g1_i2:282-2228(-)
MASQGMMVRSSAPILQSAYLGKLQEIHTHGNLHRALSLTNVSDMGGVAGSVVGVGLNAWGEGDLRSLKDELEVSKLTLSELNKALQYQIESWETWRSMQGPQDLAPQLVEFRSTRNVPQTTATSKRKSIPTADMSEYMLEQQRRTKLKTSLNPPTPTNNTLSTPTTPVLSAKKRESHTPYENDEEDEDQEQSEGDVEVDIEGENDNLATVKEDEEGEESFEEEDGGEYYEAGYESDRTENNEENAALQNPTYTGSSAITKRRGATATNKNRKRSGGSGTTRRSKMVQKNSESPTPILQQHASPTNNSLNNMNVRKKRRKGRDEDEYYPSEEDFSQSQNTQEDSQLGAVANEESEPENKIAPAVGANIFWQSMEAYFRPITEQDLQFISPTDLKNDDPSLIIPPLGPHYSQIWAAEDNGEVIDKRYRNSAGFLVRKPIVNDDIYTFEGDDNLTEKEDIVVVGDFTQRVLQALLEENLVENHPASPPPTEEEKSAKANGATDVLANNDGPLPPLYTYTKSGMYTFEERIKMELKDIGLFELNDDLEGMFGGGYGFGGGEDDEICMELRELHKQLKEQVALNNERKKEIRKHIQPFLDQQQADLKRREEYREIEQRYLKLIRKKKGGRGRWKNTTTHTTSSIPTPVSNQTG